MSADRKHCNLCKHPTPVVEGELLCKWHLKDIAKGRKTQEPPNPKSIKQSALDRAWAALWAIIKAKHPKCLAQIKGICTIEAEVGHHMAGRGVNLLKEDTILPCCHHCHQFIEAHPAWAKANGLSLSRLAIEESEEAQ